MLAARQDGRALLVPHGNASEAALASQGDVLAAGHLLTVCEHLSGRARLVPVPKLPLARTLDNAGESPDLSDVRGQRVPRRALEVAAAGGHNLLFFGPPGTGKSMLASRLPGILPELADDAAMEVASVHSVAGLPVRDGGWRQPPFRAPHHTASAVAMVGGGSSPRPGEISLAHRGVLFLDELPEFERRVLEVLREPMETGHISISRAARQVNFPARFQVVGAMNPCPCGYSGHPAVECQCTPQQVTRYRSKISGPLLDRFDLHVEVPVQGGSVLMQQGGDGESSATVRQRVIEARRRQSERGLVNAELSGRDLHAACRLAPQGEQLLAGAMEKLGLSARALHRILRVARTLADLEGCDELRQNHLVEALGYRQLDRQQGRNSVVSA